MGAVAQQTFTANGNFTAPAGCFFVTVVGTVPAPTSGRSFSRGFSSLYLGHDAFLYAWGTNTSGGCGGGSTSTVGVPTQVLNSSGINFISVDASSGSADLGSFGISSTLDVYSWGGNVHGQLGVGDVTPRSSPVMVVGGLKFVKVASAASTSIAFAAALTPSGALYAWGNNFAGQLGNGDVNSRSSPVAVLGGFSFSNFFVFCGGSSQNIFGLTSAGALYGWGANFGGQLGNGSTANGVSSPVAVLGGHSFSSVVVDSETGASYGLSGTTLYAWGANTYGNLGTGDVIPRSSPVAVLGSLSFSAFVSMNAGSIIALSTNGTTYAWGNNNNGQLGLGDVVSRSSPVAVLNSASLGFIALGSNGPSTTNFGAAFGLTASGALYAWGSGANGQLGVGDVAPRSSPVAVLGGLSFTQIHSNLQTATFAVSSGQLYSWGNAFVNSTGSSFSSPVAVITDNRQPLSFYPASTTILPVVPGTTYAVNLGATTAAPASFGTSNLGAAAYSQIVVEYEQ